MRIFLRSFIWSSRIRDIILLTMKVPMGRIANFKKEDFHMFFQKPKKKNYAPMIVGIVVGVLAALATAYVLFEKVFKKKLCAKKAAEVEAVADECVCDCECECEETVCDEAEVEVVEEA